MSTEITWPRIQARPREPRARTHVQRGSERSCSRPVIELLLAEGAGAVTALRVSEHAGVARSTIYQHWPDQHTLLLAAIDRIITPRVPTTITENLGGDLTAAVASLRKRLINRRFGAIFATLLDQANRDRAFVAAQRRFVNGVLQPIRDVLTASAQRGDLPRSVDVDEAAVQLAGPIFTQHVMLRTNISDELITNTTKQFLLQQHTGNSYRNHGLGSAERTLACSRSTSFPTCSVVDRPSSPGGQP